MSRAVVAIFGIIVLAVIGVFALEAALLSAGEEFDIEDEEWTADLGEVTQLDESERPGAFYRPDVEVWNTEPTPDPELMVEGVDYDWNQNNGTVVALESGGFDQGDTATISYSFSQTTSEHRTLTEMLSLIPNAIGLAIPAFIFVLMLILLRR